MHLFAKFQGDILSIITINSFLKHIHDIALVPLSAVCWYKLITILYMKKLSRTLGAALEVLDSIIILLRRTHLRRDIARHRKAHPLS